MRVLKFLPLLLIFFVAACANDAEDAQKTIQSFLAAAEAGDAKRVEELMRPSERSRKFTFTDENNPYKEEKHEITKVEIDRDLAVIYLKVSNKQGVKGEKRWVCVKEEGKWYFSPEKSALATGWTGPGPKKDGK
ncbi:MAG: DUF4878 domain-containing protein [Planctomycetes bacterium]|nr:DUF4878 domain-containing protein [Planctomycetota bacterium]